MRRRERPIPERSVFTPSDLWTEALAGILQRPARSMLTMLGTVLGVGAFVAVLGLTTTAAGQIGGHFDAFKETTVTINDVGDGEQHGDPQPVDFPANADATIRSLNGVVAAGVYWTVPLKQPTIGASLAVTATSRGNAGDLNVYAASPGLFAAMRTSIKTGVLFNEFHDGRSERVAVLGSGAATRLGITQLSTQPAVFINGRAFTVIGIIDDTERLPEMLIGILIPRSTAAALYPPPDPVVGPARMLVETQMGAARLVARQAAVALRPDRARAFVAVPPPDPRTLRDSVSTELTGLFLALAGICLVIGAVGITNTTLVAVIERIGEIGVRRALGASRRHIAIQFLTESTVLGIIGGLIGTAFGVMVVVCVALAKQWTAILEPSTVLPAPFIGAAVGILAGLYPAYRAATVEPLEALRR